jgi:hypothetical protein
METACCSLKLFKMLRRVELEKTRNPVRPSQLPPRGEEDRAEQEPRKMRKKQSDYSIHCSLLLML